MTKTLKRSEIPDHRVSGKLKAYKTSQNGIVIEGFANAATVDRAKEIIDPEAFTKSNGLQNFLKNPTILFDHGLDPNVGSLPIGRAIEVTPSEKGLFIKAKISQAKDPPISTIRSLIEEGNLRAFSVGFNPEEVEGPDEKGVSTIKSAELFEVSVVGIPMNQDSLFSMVNKSGKKVLKKSYSLICADICKAKGAKFGEAANIKIDDLVTEEKSRDDIISQIAEAAGVSDAVILDVLSGALQEIPNQIMDAFKSVIGDDLKLFGEDEDKEDDDDDEEKQDDDKSEKSTDDDESDDDEDDEEAKSKKDFQDCVNGKIPKLIEEGKDQDEAVATAISMCRESEKCAITPTREMYESFLKTVDRTLKQADQENVPDEVTEPIRTATPDSELGASPMLDQVKQSNVLLGTIANEMKLFTDSIRGMTDEIVNAVAKLGNTGNDDSVQAKLTEEDSEPDESEDEKKKRLRIEKAKSHLEKLANRLEQLGVTLSDKELNNE